MDVSPTPEDQRLIALWEEHIRLEFTQRDATVATRKVQDPSLPSNQLIRERRRR